MNELWTIPQKEEWNHMYYRSLDLSMKIYLAKLSDDNMPVLELMADDGSWTNNKIIHIGNGKISIHDNKKMMLWTSYLLGHEIQHVLSTTNKSWMYGLEGGMKTVCEEFSRIAELRPRRFVKDSDYERFLDDMAKQGYQISMHAMQKFVHYIVNSLEDGRIERIRCIRNPGFLNYVKICRGQLWMEESITQEMKDQIDDPRVYLSVILNQVLTLATMSIYQKGFIEIAANNIHVHQLLQKLIPHIRNAVNSPTCRGCMDEAIAICRILTAEIVAACKLTPLEELMSNLIQIFADNQNYIADSRTEETGEAGVTIEIFGVSDLKTDEEEKSGSQNNTSDKNSSEKHEKEKQDAFSSTDSVSEAMEEANRASSEELETAIRSGRIPKREIPKQDISKSKEDVLPDLTSVNVEYGNQVQFKEMKRSYKPNIQMPVDLLARAKNLKRKIEKIFKTQEYPALRGQNKGRIDAPKVYKLAMNQMDFFKRDQQSEPFDGCVYFLMDNSGSMRNGKGSKRFYCCSGGAIIEYAFSDFVLMKIVAFNAYGINDVVHNVIKDWHEKVHANATWNFYEQDTCGHGNKDGYSIRVATKELLSRPEKNKLLLIASDGLPSAYSGGEAQGVKDVQSAVKEARKSGIHVVAIYTNEDVTEKNREIKMFQMIYEANCIVTKPENMESELIRIMKRFCFH